MQVDPRAAQRQRLGPVRADHHHQDQPGRGPQRAERRDRRDSRRLGRDQRQHHGAGAAYDTLQELKTLLDAGDATDQAAITAINTALGYRLRVDAAQSLTSGQMQQGRDNLNVYSKTEIGDVSANFVTVFESGLL
jgi:hypothetical protein